MYQLADIGYSTDSQTAECWSGGEGGWGGVKGGRRERLRGSVERNGPNCATTDLTEFVYSLGHIRFCTHDEPEEGD